MKEAKEETNWGRQGRIHRVQLAFEFSIKKLLGIFKSDNSCGIT